MLEKTIQILEYSLYCSKTFYKFSTSRYKYQLSLKVHQSLLQVDLLHFPSHHILTNCWQVAFVKKAADGKYHHLHVSGKFSKFFSIYI